MADFAPNFTPRIRTGYSVQGTPHHFDIRAPRGTLAGDIPDYVAKIEAFLDALQGLRFTDWVVTSCQYALTDSDLFLPIEPPAPAAGTANTAGRLATTRDFQVRFQGRSFNGARWSLSLFGLNLTSAAASVQDWRVTNAESADISLASGVITETPPTWRAIDGAELVIYPYVSCKYNDHWVNATRHG